MYIYIIYIVLFRKLIFFDNEIIKKNNLKKYIEKNNKKFFKT